ncbi:MAG: CDP-alcohol phosphatidyltransferase family protein [Pseudonocardiales bacterium]|nr:CDP-alcohol phosphatidyltransferase family protein [Pseudonocardiales bacterium]
MLDGQFRSTVDKTVRPIGQNLKKTGLSADHFTLAGLVLSAFAAVAIGSAHLRVGLLLVVLTGLCDTLDGAVAKAAGTSSSRGAFFDSVADRVSDALLFGGVAWYFADTHPGTLVMLPVAVLATSSIISYQRAKAESLGFAAKGGIMERAERIILLALGLLFDALLVPVLVIMLVLTIVTAGQRFAKVWQAASKERPVPVRSRRSARRRSRPTVAERRDAWRSRTGERRNLPRR